MKGSSSGFGGLKKLRQTLVRAQEQARRDQLAAARLPKQSAPVPAEDALLFRRAMQAVTPLQTSRDKGKAADKTASPTTAPNAEQLARRRSALGESKATVVVPLSDQYAPSLGTDAGIAWFAPDMAPDTPRRLQRGQWPVQARIDLHGMKSDTARVALIAFLADCLAHRVRCVRVIHGKGYGSAGATPVLREKTPVWLMQHADVCAFVQAPSAEGGEGAVLALLRSPALPEG